MFFKSDAKIKSRLREVESRVKLGSSSNLQEDLEFLAHNYSAMGAWDKAHAVTEHMVSLAEGTADANLSIWEAVDDTLPTKNRDEYQRLIIGLCIIGPLLV